MLDLLDRLRYNRRMLSNKQRADWLMSIKSGDEVVQGYGSSETIIKVTDVVGDDIFVDTLVQGNAQMGYSMNSPTASYNRTTGRGNIQPSAVLVGPVYPGHRHDVVISKIKSALMLSSIDEANEILALVERQKRIKYASK